MLQTALSPVDILVTNDLTVFFEINVLNTVVLQLLPFLQLLFLQIKFLIALKATCTFSKYNYISRADFLYSI